MLLSSKTSQIISRDLGGGGILCGLQDYKKLCMILYIIVSMYKEVAKKSSPNGKIKNKLCDQY